MMISSSQNATFEHCISHWMPRPCVSAGEDFNKVGGVKHCLSTQRPALGKEPISLSLKASLSNQRLARNRCGQELSPTQPSLSLSLFDSPLVVQNDHGVSSSVTPAQQQQEEQHECGVSSHLAYCRREFFRIVDV